MDLPRPDTRAALAALSPLTLLATFAVPVGAQLSPRRAPPAEVAAARAAFVEGVARVSRNPAAFEQAAAAGQGCEVSLMSRRRERGDSLVERQQFDAGFLSTRMRMSIAPEGGVIVFTYMAADGGTGVRRESARGPQATTSPTASSASVREVVLLVAETSNQPDVQALMAAWTSLVRACGGDLAP